MSNRFGDLERCDLRPGNVHSADGWRTVLEPVAAPYRERTSRRFFRGDAAFALPELYEFLEAEGYKYAIRLKANAVLQDRIADLLRRPVGRPPKYVRRLYASFNYKTGSWGRKRRVVAKVEWHPGELYPRVGFIVTNVTRPAERMVAFYNQGGTAEQDIKEGKNSVTWTRLSCRRFAANAMRLQLHALAYDLAIFYLRALALPEPVKQRSLTTVRDRVVKIGACVVRHRRSIIFQMAEVMLPRVLLGQMLAAIAALRPSPPLGRFERRRLQLSRKPTAAAELRPDRSRKRLSFAPTATTDRSDATRASFRRRRRCICGRIADTLTGR